MSGQCSKWVFWEVGTQLSLILELTSQKLTSEFIMVKRLRRGEPTSGCCCLTRTYSESFSGVLWWCKGYASTSQKQGRYRQSVWFKSYLCHFVALQPWWGYSASLLFIIYKVGTNTGVTVRTAGGIAWGNNYSGKKRQFWHLTSVASG